MGQKKMMRIFSNFNQAFNPVPKKEDYSLSSATFKEALFSV